MGVAGLSFEGPLCGVVGMSLEGAIVLDVKGGLRAERVELRLIGETRGPLLGDAAPPPPFALTANIALPAHLAHGRHRLPFGLPLPTDLAPSYALGSWRRAFELSATVVVPWWPDTRAAAAVLIEAAAPDELPRQAAARKPRTSDDARSGLVLLEVDTDALHAGDLLTGQVTVKARSEPHEVAFVERLVLPGGEPMEEGRVRRVVLAFMNESKSRRFEEFSVRLPGDLNPSFEAPGERLVHEVVVFEKPAHGEGAAVAVVPVRVVPTRTRLAWQGAGRPPPRQREEQALRRAAEACGAELRDGRLVREFGPVRAAISLAVNPHPPVEFAAELSYPPLGLGLRAGTSSGQPRRDITFSLGGLPAEQVEGRDPGQVRAFLLPLLARFEPFAALTADDESMTLEAQGNDSGDDLVAFAEHTFALARDWQGALARVPPPPPLAASLPAWEKLAAELRGTLQVGSLTVEGSFDGHAVVVGPTWGARGKPTGLSILLRAIVVESIGHLSLKGPSPPLPLGLSERARDHLERLLEERAQLSLQGDRVVYTTAQRAADPAAALGWLPILSDLVRVLSPGGSPYR